MNAIWHISNHLRNNTRLDSILDLYHTTVGLTISISSGILARTYLEPFLRPGESVLVLVIRDYVRQF